MQNKKQLNWEIGGRIQTARENAGMTQEKLAESIDRSTQFISTIERGVAGPSLETVISLCDVLSVSADWLLRGKDPVSAAGIAAKLEKVPPEKLAWIDRMIDCILHLLSQ